MSQPKNNKKIKKGKPNLPWVMIFILGIGVALVIGAVFVFSRPSQTKAGNSSPGSPVLKVNQEKVDLGDVKFNQTVQVTFQLTNIGEQSLRFTKEPYIELVEGC